MAPRTRHRAQPDLLQLEMLATTVASTPTSQDSASAPTSHEQLRCATSGTPEAWTSELAHEREMAAIECQLCPKRLWCLTSALETDEGEDLFGVWGGLTETELAAERTQGYTPRQILERAQTRERQHLLALAVKSATRSQRRARVPANPDLMAEVVGAA